MDGLKLQLQVDRNNTLYNETQRVATNARSKMYFSRHSQGYRFIAYLIKLQSSPGKRGGRSHIRVIRVCLSASRLFDSGTGYKNRPPFTGRLRGIFYISLSLRSGSVFFLTIPDYSWSTLGAKISLPLSSKQVNYCPGQGLKFTSFVQNRKDTEGTPQ